MLKFDPVPQNVAPAAADCITRKPFGPRSMRLASSRRYRRPALVDVRSPTPSATGINRDKACIPFCTPVSAYWPFVAEQLKRVSGNSRHMLIAPLVASLRSPMGITSRRSGLLAGVTVLVIGVPVAGNDVDALVHAPPGIGWER